MKKEQVLGIVRPLLTAILSAFAAKWFKDDASIQAIVASVAAAIVAFWAIFDKTSNGLNAWASAFRHVVALASGVCFAVIPDNKLVVEILTALGTILAALSGAVSNSNANRIK